MDTLNQSSMGDALKRKHFYSLEEYEKIVANAREGERYEYADGEIIVLDEYTTDNHNQVVLNTATLLAAHYYPKACRVYTENVRLAIEQEKNYRQPDVMVTCSERDRNSRDAKRDPVILVEVLSPATSFTDLVEKVKLYQKIPTLAVYMIINPAKVWVGVYENISGQGFSPIVEYDTIDSRIELSAIGLTIPVESLYRMVEFT
jgi:Uma2 family endonuclease